ncbi:MAG: ABC transporter permease [Candidatus Alkaliphilus sp. MAG34]|nr:ABC transporter permease [Clostridiales bacterium]
MGHIIDGIKDAVNLLLSFDKEIYGIIGLSIYVSLTSTLVSGIIAIPTGIMLGIKSFPGKKAVVRVLYTMMSLPPVIVGLVVFLFISRNGPLGDLRIVYTPTAIIVAQVFLVTPIIMGYVYSGARERGEEIQDLAYTLGASRGQALILLIRELRINIFSAIVTGYGRAISEVGAVMVVGGNIKGHTRVMTTVIAMLKNMGQYGMAIAIGIILLLISFVINSVLYRLQRED